MAVAKVLTARKRPKPASFWPVQRHWTVSGPGGPWTSERGEGHDRRPRESGPRLADGVGAVRAEVALRSSLELQRTLDVSARTTGRWPRWRPTRPTIV